MPTPLAVPRVSASEPSSFLPGRGRSVVSPCVIGPSLQCCVIERPSIYQPFHKLNITQANALGTETTLVNIQFDKLCKQLSVRSSSRLSVCVPGFIID